MSLTQIQESLLKKAEKERQAIIKSLQLDPEFSGKIDFSKKVHRKLVDKAIKFCLYRIQVIEKYGHFKAHDHEVLRPVFNHHQSDIGKLVFEDLLIELKPRIYHAEEDKSDMKEWDLHLGFLVKLIEKSAEYKYSKLKKKDQHSVKTNLLDTKFIKNLLRKNFPQLAEKILGREEEDNSTNSNSSPTVILGIDFTSSANEKLNTIRSVEVVITYHKELTGKKKFVYDDKTYRLWHDIQWIKRELKPDIFSQHLKFDYDLATAAIRVLYFKAKSLDKNFEEDKFPLVKDYIYNRAQRRWEIAAKFGITYDQAKEVFQYIGNNGQLINNKHKGLWHITKGYYITEKMVQDEYLNKFADEVKKLWKIYVRKNNMEALFGANSTSKFSQSKFTGGIQIDGLDDDYVSNKDQFLLYFRTERQILEIMKSYMEKKCADLFLEHDGFRSSVELTEEELAELDLLVLEKTNVEIKLEQNKKKENNQPHPTTNSNSSPTVILGIDFTVFDESPAGRAMRAKVEQIERNKSNAKSMLSEYELALA